MLAHFSKLAVKSLAKPNFATQTTLVRCAGTAVDMNAPKSTGFDEAALLTKYDVDLALRLKFSDKVIRAKPTTPGKRHFIRIDRSELYNGAPIKELTSFKRRTGGRNNRGRITARGRGGGARPRYRLIDFSRTITDIPGVVQRLEHDPNRSAHIALISYPDNRLQYVIATQGMSPGDTIMTSRNGELDIRPGNAMRLRDMPIGSTISCIESRVGGGAVFARSAGTSAMLIEKDNTPRKNYALVRIASKEVRLIHLDCLGVIGAVSNPLKHVESLGKAGRARWLGRRPFSRGIARNPVDHPHGGGAGKGRSGRPSCSPTGVLAKGFKTRRKRKPSQFTVVPRGGGVLNL